MLSILFRIFRWLCFPVFPSVTYLHLLLSKGDITDLAVSSNNALVASSSNDCIIRTVSVWFLISLDIMTFAYSSFLQSILLCSFWPIITVAFARWAANFSSAWTYRSRYCHCFQSKTQCYISASIVRLVLFCCSIFILTLFLTHFVFGFSVFPPFVSLFYSVSFYTVTNSKL